MPIALVTGSAGLIGAETVRRFASEGLDVIGVDNDMRAYFFGADASTKWSAARLSAEVKNYEHLSIDICDFQGLEAMFSRYKSNISVVIHTAAQPSHDWAAQGPITDFGINARDTLNLLELTKSYSPNASFIFTSTNKVYSDLPNAPPFVEGATRWNVDPSHPYAARGIDETMSIDQSTHSEFGASKIVADMLVQEYGRYFGRRTVCFRGRGSNQGNTQNEKSPYHQSSTDFQCYLDMAFFESRLYPSSQYCSSLVFQSYLIFDVTTTKRAS